jgi:hypothetical protein
MVIQPQRIAFSPETFLSEVGEFGKVAAKELDFKPKPLGADVQGREIKGLDLTLIVGRVEHRQADRVFQTQDNSAFIIDVRILK